MAKKTDGFGVVDIKLEIPIDAPVQRVWNAIIKDSTKWWPRDFYAGADAKRFVFEPKLGGRVYEDWGDGNGLIWYDVIGIEAPKHLLLRGHLTAQFGGPASSFLELRLEARGKATTLHLRDNVFGSIGPKAEQSLTSGWRALFEDALKKYVEGK